MADAAKPNGLDEDLFNAVFIAGMGSPVSADTIIQVAAALVVYRRRMFQEPGNRRCEMFEDILRANELFLAPPAGRA